MLERGRFFVFCGDMEPFSVVVGGATSGNVGGVLLSAGCGCGTLLTGFGGMGRDAAAAGIGCETVVEVGRTTVTLAIDPVACPFSALPASFVSLALDAFIPRFLVYRAMSLSVTPTSLV